MIPLLANIWAKITTIVVVIGIETTEIEIETEIATVVETETVIGMETVIETEIAVVIVTGGLVVIETEIAMTRPATAVPTKEVRHPSMTVTQVPDECPLIFEI